MSATARIRETAIQPQVLSLDIGYCGAAFCFSWALSSVLLRLFASLLYDMPFALLYAVCSIQASNIVFE